MNLVREYINDDYYYVELLSQSLNEEFNINRIESIINKISDKTFAITRLIKKFNESRNFSIKHYLAVIIATLGFIVFTNIPFKDISRPRINQIAKIFVQRPIINIEKVKTEILKPEVLKKEEQKLIPSRFIDIDKAHITDSTKNFIKHHEKLRLEAYSIGDGMITIGYGHAYPERRSPYRVGHKITEKRAEEIFISDIKAAEEGVKRIIKSWNNPKVQWKITQGMFDAMVSMAYNMGVKGLRDTQFMQLVKAGKFKTAAERLKITKIQSKIKVKQKDGTTKDVFVEMPGLKVRRLEEHKMFIS